MKTLKESCEVLLDAFKKGENNDAEFTKAYTDSLKFIQLVFMEESKQFVAVSEAVKAFTSSGRSAETRLQLKTLTTDILNGLFSKRPVEIQI